MRMKLLCATDLGARSDEALLRTAQLAQQMNAQAMFLHVVDDTQTDRVIRMKVNRAHVRLLSQSELAMKHAPEDAHVQVRLGKVVQSVANVAREWNPDLIVMAAPRRRPLDVLIGSTAERIIRATNRPVLLVSGPASARYERVVLATDLSSVSVHIARTAASMRMLDSAYAWIVHAFQLPYHGLIADEKLVEEQIAEHTKRWRSAVSQEVVQDLANAGVDVGRIQVSVEPARPFDAIERAMQHVRPQLLVIGVSRWFMLKRMLFTSVAGQVLRSVDCDILAVSPPPVRKLWSRAA